jgi:hypothetical protein
MAHEYIPSNDAGPDVKPAAFAHRIRSAEEMPPVFQTRAVKNFQRDEESYGKAVDYACAYGNDSD